MIISLTFWSGIFSDQVFSTAKSAIIQWHYGILLKLFFMLAGVVTERIREAYQNELAPKMIIFPGCVFVCVTVTSLRYFHSYDILLF